MAEPKVRFRQNDGSKYPSWNEIMLGDIATRVTRKNSQNETDRPLTIASIEGLVDQRTYFSKTIASKDMSGYFLLKRGEFAYNKSYSVGYDYGSIKRLDKYDMGALSTLYICFALNEDENSNFYNCYFNGLSWYNQMLDICAEGARNHGLLNVSPNDFFKIKLSVPASREEQQKIVDFFAAIDEVISASDAEVQNLELQKKVAMKKIFSKEVRFTRRDGSNFPEWENVRFGDVFTEIARKTSDTETYPLFSLTIEDGVTAKTERYERSYLVKKTEDNYKIVPPNAFVYNPMNLRFGALAPSHEDKEVCVSQYYNVFSINDETTLGFWESYLVTDEMLKFYFSIATGSLVEKLRVHYSNFVNIVKPIPCAEEQRLIADFLSDFDEAIAAAKRELELWKELKKGLLQQMFI